MLLEVAGVFALLGIGMFVVGLAYDRPELMMFGAIIMVGIGGTGVVQGYQVQDGETMTETYNNTTNTTYTEVTPQYEDVDAISSFPLELIVLLLGAIMLMTATGRASEQ